VWPVVLSVALRDSLTVGRTVCVASGTVCGAKGQFDSRMNELCD
jgi:hypothetical protein